MGYTRFEHDIFLSYVRADDEGTRWVSQFEEELRIALMHRGSKQITLWRDTRESPILRTEVFLSATSYATTLPPSRGRRGSFG